MIVFLIDTADLATIEQHVQTAKQQYRMAARMPVKYVRQPHRLPATVTQVLAFKHVYADDPHLKAWCAAQPSAQRVVLWSNYPHPDEVRLVLQLHPDARWVGLYHDLLQPDFWERADHSQNPQVIISEFQNQLLLDAERWHPDARPLLHRVVSNLHLSCINDVARLLYGGQHPGHQFAKVCRMTGHAPPKFLLSAAQLAAFRLAVERGASPLETAQALGRRTHEHWRVFVRHALGDAHPDFSRTLSAPLIEGVRGLFAQRDSSVPSNETLRDLVRRCTAA